MILKVFLSLRENCGINSDSDKKLSDSEYAGDVVRLCEDPGKLRRFLDRQNDCVATSGMHFSLSKCKMVLHDWMD